jgi:hypothetical protein
MQYIAVTEQFTPEIPMMDYYVVTVDKASSYTTLLFSVLYLFNEIF